MRLSICLLILLIFLSCGKQEEIDYRVPDDMLEVAVVPGKHIGSPFLHVTINDEFEWPGPDGSSDDKVYYQVDLIRSAGDTLAGVGRLTDEERFSIVYVVPDIVGEQATLSPDEIDARTEANRASRDALIEQINAILEAGETVPDNVASRLDSITYDWDFMLEERQQVYDYEVLLIPVDPDRGILRQDGGGAAPREIRYTWGTEVNNDADPCHGKTPEQCARDRINAFRDRICAATNADGTPRFPEYCRLLRSMSEKDPPEPLVECTIPREVHGITGGVYDPESGQITLDGEHYLTSDCSDATLLHELLHAREFGAGMYPNLDNLRAAEEKLQKALEDRETARAAGDQVAELDAVRRAAEAMVDIQRLEQAAGKEKIKAECNALFATIDNADLFEYPGDGTAWMKENIKDMVGELAAERHLFNLPMKTPELCDCFQKIKRYVDGQEPIKNNFDRDIATRDRNGNNVTWTKFIEGLTRNYCP